MQQDIKSLPHLPRPVVLGTWSFGKTACQAGWAVVGSPGGSSLDAVEQGARAVEADPTCMTVGLGGYPDRLGETSLDASIMLSPSRCGSVCYVRRHMHAISIARAVMEETPHVMLAGDGADLFAVRQGMTPMDLATPESFAAWEKWVREHPEFRHSVETVLPPKNIEQRSADQTDPDEDLSHNRYHDTVGVLAIDASGQLAGACSTSGWAFKMPGRVGDSPIIGHGLYVQPGVGAAVATGSGELVMGVCGAFLAIETLRGGASPLEAAVAVLERIIESFALEDQHQVALMVLAADGRFSSAALREGFKMAIRSADQDDLVPASRVMLP